MNKKSKAERLIKNFARELLNLNDGKKIPEEWVIKLRVALKPASRKQGRRIDIKTNAAVVKELVLALDKVTGPRTKHHNPGVRKNIIAQRTGVSRKSIDRRAAEVELLDKSGVLPLESDRRKALLEGAAGAIFSEISQEMNNESRRR